MEGEQMETRSIATTVSEDGQIKYSLHGYRGEIRDGADRVGILQNPGRSGKALDADELRRYAEFILGLATILDEQNEVSNGTV